MVMIYVIHPQAANVIVHVKRAEEIFYPQEARVKRACQNPTKLIVTDVKIVIICIHCVSVSSCHSVEIWIDACQKIIVDFIEVVVLPLAEVKFISHSVSQEACVVSNVTQA